MDNYTENSGLRSEDRSDYIENFSLSFSSNNVAELSQLSGIEIGVLKSKLPYIIAALLNKLTLIESDLKAELEKIIEVRSQFFIPGKNDYPVPKDDISKENFFNDSYFALSSLLKTDPDNFIDEVSVQIQLKREDTSKIFNYIAPHFLDQFALFYNIKNPNFLSNKDEDLCSDESHIKSEDSINEKNLSVWIINILKFSSSRLNKFIHTLVSALIKVTRQFLSALIRSKYIIHLAIGVFFAFFVFMYFYGRAQKISNLSENNNPYALAVPIEESELISEDGVSSVESVPLLLPDFSPETSPYKLLEFLRQATADGPDGVFKISEFSFKNGKAEIGEAAIEELFYVSRILLIYPEVRIVITKQDNKFPSVLPREQNKFMYLLARELVKNGISEDRLTLDYFESKAQSSAGKELVPPADGMVSFRVAKN